MSKKEPEPKSKSGGIGKLSHNLGDDSNDLKQGVSTQNQINDKNELEKDNEAVLEPTPPVLHSPKQESENQETLSQSEPSPDEPEDKNIPSDNKPRI